jgi:predicted histone-like DNA-binding protein
MTVKFNVVARGNPGNPAAPKKHYPSVVASGRMTLRKLARRIADISTVSSGDTMAVLETMLNVIPEELAEGNIVELGDFGSFWLKNNAEGSDAPEDVSASHITRLLPRFNPGKEFKKTLQTVDYEKA